MVAPADLVEGREAFTRRAWGTAYERLRAVGITHLAPADLGSARHRGVPGRRPRRDDRSPGAVLPPEHRRGRTTGRGPRRELVDLRLHRERQSRRRRGLGRSGAAAAGADARGPRRARLPARPRDDAPRLRGRVPGRVRGWRPRSWRPANGGTTATSPRWVFRPAAGCCCTPVRCAQGLALLDEAMLRVTGGEVSPILTGEIFCSLIEACQEIGDYRRISDWTGALTRWCDTQPDLVPFTGQCAVHRAQVLQLHGDYAEALTELAVASERYAANGAARDRPGPLRARRGAPGPGRLRRRRVGVRRGAGLRPRGSARAVPALAGPRAAPPRRVAAVRRQLDESHNPVARARLLPAAVEILIRCNAVEDARAAAAELEEIAERFALRGACRLGRRMRRERFCSPTARRRRR